MRPNFQRSLSLQDANPFHMQDSVQGEPYVVCGSAVPYVVCGSAVPTKKRPPCLDET